MINSYKNIEKYDPYGEQRGHVNRARVGLAEQKQQKAWDGHQQGAHMSENS